MSLDTVLAIACFTPLTLFIVFIVLGDWAQTRAEDEVSRPMRPTQGLVGMTSAQVLGLIAGVLIGYVAMEVRAAIQQARRYHESVLAEARWIYQRSPALARHYLKAAHRATRGQ